MIQNLSAIVQHAIDPRNRRLTRPGQVFRRRIPKMRQPEGRANLLTSEGCDWRRGPSPATTGRVGACRGSRPCEARASKWVETSTSPGCGALDILPSSGDRRRSRYPGISNLRLRGSGNRLQRLLIAQVPLAQGRFHPSGRTQAVYKGEPPPGLFGGFSTEGR